MLSSPSCIHRVDFWNLSSGFYIYLFNVISLSFVPSFQDIKLYLNLNCVIHYLNEGTLIIFLTIRKTFFKNLFIFHYTHKCLYAKTASLLLMLDFLFNFKIFLKSSYCTNR